MDNCGSCIAEYRVHYLPVLNERCKVSFTSDSLREQDFKLVFFANELDLPPNCIYNTTIEAINNAGKINSTGNISFSKLQL